jgi:hypothetical protein
MRGRLEERMRYTYGVFVCSVCEHEYAERLPRLHEKMPNCPLCDGSSLLRHPLSDRFTSIHWQAGVGIALILWDQVLPLIPAWPF